MSRATRSSFDAFCGDAIDLLQRARVAYLIIGGIAVAVVGEPRVTADLDVVAYLDTDGAEALIEQARAAGFAVAADEREQLRDTGTLRFRKGRFQLDIILASLPFEDAARARAHRQKLFGRTVPLPTPEDLILFKVLAGRDKDLVDAVGVARRHLASLDVRYLVSTIDGICDLAEDLGPRQRLDEVIRKAGT
ncbi:MAG TPA: hypothetical protein VHE35_26410 [Kofleriaceae bacterium]|nr:hypothetical protein [Kofleriaceae bacterium]